VRHLASARLEVLEMAGQALGFMQGSYILDSGETGQLQLTRSFDDVVFFQIA